MPSKKPVIEFRNVAKQYPLEGGTFYQALNGISLKIYEGEFVSIMGPSGSGKSTTMHIMGALDTPTSGKYFFKGQDISTYTDDELAKIRNKEIGFVFQSFNLLPKISVLKNVESPMMYAGIPSSERQKRALETLSQVRIAEKAQNKANHISGGEIQRVAIARALVMDPSIILADEPTGNLDTKTSSEIMTFLKNLNKEGHTIIVITHQDHVASYTKRTIKIVDGKITQDTHS